MSHREPANDNSKSPSDESARREEAESKFFFTHPQFEQVRQRVEQRLQSYNPDAGLLDLSGCGIDDLVVDHVLSLFASVSHVTALDLCGNGGFRLDRHAAAIAKFFPELATLRVSGGGYNEILGIATNFKALTELDLRGAHVEDRGAVVIATHLKKLTKLNLAENWISRDGAIAIAEECSSLRELDVSNNNIGLDGVLAISKHLEQLTDLDIGNTERSYEQTGIAGATAIAERLPRLTSLNIQRHNIGDDGVSLIAKNLTRLTSLDISDNWTGDKGAFAVAEYLAALTILKHNTNSLKPKGAIAIAKSLRKLKELHLWRNDIQDEGITAIARHLTALEYLDVENNDIRDAGFIAIGENRTALKTLIIRDNGISDARIVISVLKRLTRTEAGGLQSIYIEHNSIKWPGTNEPVHGGILCESNPKRLLELLLELKTDSGTFASASVALMGRAFHGKTHLSRWIVAKESQFESLRALIPMEKRTIGYHRYNTVLSTSQHGQEGLGDVLLTVVDVSGHREQINSVSNLVYMNAGRSVFCLVVKASESFKHGNWGHYYLRLIESLKVQKHIVEDGHAYQSSDIVDSPAGADRIPVIIVVTHARGENTIELPTQSELHIAYPLLDVLVVDHWEATEGNQHLPSLHKAIGQQLNKISALREQVYEKTNTIREEIARRFDLDIGLAEELPPRTNSISVDEFRGICRLAEETNEAVQDATIRILASLGFIAIVGSNKRFRPETRLLNPRFVNHYLFSGILERGRRELKNGFMSNDWFDDLARDIKDPLEIQGLKDLMRDCLVTFDWRSAGYPSGQFVPDLLPASPPEERTGWQDAQCKITLRPKGFLNEAAFFNFVSARKSDLRPVYLATHPDGSQKQTLLFRNECVMNSGACEALVKVDVIEQTIDIKVKGPDYSLSQSYGEGLRQTLRHNVDSDLEGEWELGVFDRIIRSLSETDETPLRARKIVRWILEGLNDTQRRHTWPGHEMGKCLEDSKTHDREIGDSSGKKWNLAKRSIKMLIDLKLIEGGEKSGFRLTEHTGHPFIIWAKHNHRFD